MLSNQDVLYDYTADLRGIGNRTDVMYGSYKILVWVYFSVRPWYISVLKRDVKHQLTNYFSESEAFGGLLLPSPCDVMWRDDSRGEMLGRQSQSGRRHCGQPSYHSRVHAATTNDHQPNSPGDRLLGHTSLILAEWTRCVVGPFVYTSRGGVRAAGQS